MCEHKVFSFETGECVECHPVAEHPTHDTIPAEPSRLSRLANAVRYETALCGCRLVEGAGPSFVDMCEWHRKHCC